MHTRILSDFRLLLTCDFNATLLFIICIPQAGVKTLPTLRTSAFTSRILAGLIVIVIVIVTLQ